MRRRAGGIAAVLAAVMAMTATAEASRIQESVFQDDDLLLYAQPAAVDATMAELAQLGVDRVRLSAIWRDLSPPERPADASDPSAYDPAVLDRLDVAVSAAARHGVGVLLNVRGGAPAWAQGAKRPARLRGRDAFKPRAGAFGRFVRMLGRRYDGSYRDENATRQILPRVPAWSVWNEPNWGGLLQPQSQRHRATRRMRPFAPQLYRRLFRAATGALAATGHGGDTILIGETAPLGTSSRLSPTSHLTPVRFLRSLFCLDGRLKPLRRRAAKRDRCDFDRAGALTATGYAHHPYPVVHPPALPSRNREHIRLADSRRLERLLDAARRHGRLPGRLPIWYTEFGYQTRPPDPFRGIKLGLQARWLTRAERITYSDRRVLGHTQFLLRDSPPNPGAQPGDRFYWSTYQTGLRYVDGRAKPALTAYRLPFLNLGRVRSGRPARFWGLVRGGRDGEPQTVLLQHQTARGAEWTAVRQFTVTDLKGYFTVRTARARAGRYRAAWVRDGALVASAPTAMRR